MIRSDLWRLRAPSATLHSTILIACLVSLTTLVPSRPCFAQSDEAIRRQELLLGQIPRNRRLRETLISVNSLQTHGRTAEALKTIQWILDQPFDTFVFAGRKPPTSVKFLAEEKLRSFPADWRQQYERTYGQTAAQLLRDAQRGDDDRPAVELLRRFGQTAAAEDAAEWLARRWLDRGELELALSVLVPNRGDLRGVSARRLTAAALVADAGGNAQLAGELHEELERRRNSTNPNDRPRSAPPVALPSASDERLHVPFAHSEPSLTAESIPVLCPEWTVALHAPSKRSPLGLTFDHWRSDLQSKNLTPVVPNLPLVVRNQAILRTHEGVSGYSLSDGNKLWTFACESSADGFLQEVSRNRPADAGFDAVFLPEVLKWWYSSNTQLGYLASDGVRLYAIDSLAVPPGASQRSETFSPRNAEESNRLLALELPPTANSTPKLVWSRGRASKLQDAATRGQYFLGPPLPQAGRLLTMLEVDREIRLTALHPETGETLWEQPLAAVDRSAVRDGERAFVASVPIPAAGLIVCPTHAGVLAAVDGVTGQLRWSYYDADLPPENTGRQRSMVIERGRPGFAPSTVVHRERVLHLPANSSSLHCLDLDTGLLQWTIPRQRACSIAAVRDGLVLLVEDQAVRAVKLLDGADVWKQTLPPIVGTGLALETELLLPLDQGRMAWLDVATGRPLSWQPPRPNLSLGNLVTCGEEVLSLGTDGLTVFPQAKRIRQSLQADRLKAGDKAVMAVDLSFAAGDLDQAETSLEFALSTEVTSTQQAELQRLLRELLYHRLDTEADESVALLARLKQLVTTPEERGRYIARQARFAIEEKDLPRLRAALEDLSQLPADVTFPSADEAAWSYSSAACCRHLLAEIEPESPEFVQAFRRSLLQRLTSGVRANADLGTWRFMLEVCRDDPEIGMLRDQLADRLRRAGDRHAAEIWWLQNLHGDDERQAAAAATRLVTLWTAAGFPRDSARLLNDLAQKWATETLPTGQTAADFAASLPERDEGRQWRQRMVIPQGRIESVAIRAGRELQLPDLTPQAAARRSSANREASPFEELEYARRLTMNDPSATDLVVSKREQESTLGVVDKWTSQVIHRWPLPAAFNTPSLNSSAMQGHFLPVTASGEFRGYSLLGMAEESPLWRRRPPELARQIAAPLIGPGGPSFVTFQSQNRLYVCRPDDGSILWERSDLEPKGGLHADPSSGIAGDERCLIVFGADPANYTLFETLTGKRLRQGRLSLSQSQPPRAFGRKILRVARERGQWFARVWDPLEDRIELNQSLGERNLAIRSVGPTELVWLNFEGQLRGYDVLQSAPTLAVNFAEELEGMNQLGFLRDGDRYFVNLQRNVHAAAVRGDHNSAVDDTLLRSVYIRDDLYAIDGRTNRILWKRTVPNRSLLRLDPPGLPFLVLLSRVRDRQDQTRQTLLVEVVDADNGQLLARNDNLTFDRIVQVDYDGLDRTLTLRGVKTKIEIRLFVGPATND